MVTPTETHSNIDNNNNPQPAPLAWKEFRRRSGILSHGPRIYTYTTPCIFLTPPSPSPRSTDSTQYVALVTQALQELGASTGGNIAAWIAKTFDIPSDKINSRRLHYMVNAILSSPKYRHLFHKEQVLRDEKRTLWRLRRYDEDDTSPFSPFPADVSPLASSFPSSPAIVPSTDNTPTHHGTFETTISPATSPSSPLTDILSTPPLPLSSRRRKRRESDESFEPKKVKVSSIIE